MKRIPIDTFHIDRSTGEIVDPPTPTETPASLRALADGADAFCGEPTERSAELRERAAKMERPTCTCGKGRPNPDDEVRLCPVHGNGFSKPPEPPAQPQPHTAGKPTAGPYRVSGKTDIVRPDGSLYAYVSAGGESKAVALLAEARNVETETGLTPQQLAEEREAAMMLAEQIQTACGATAFQRDALAAQLEDALAALREIAQGMGNLPIEDIGPDGVHGVNDGRQRAIYLARYVSVARAQLAKGGQNE